ncbi:unnamed protein product [Paramecium sonneborni]|uniref:Uncharacterized protein n=1 Tax=Paramecium sonneborni TaxID=65129 RepID=A0A8S1LVK5_9CILI|nr:unnamed protein product [Paramecium sonneborni]
MSIQLEKFKQIDIDNSGATTIFDQFDKIFFDQWYNYQSTQNER